MRSVALPCGGSSQRRYSSGVSSLQPSRPNSAKVASNDLALDVRERSRSLPKAQSPPRVEGNRLWAATSRSHRRSRGTPMPRRMVRLVGRVPSYTDLCDAPKAGLDANARVQGGRVAKESSDETIIRHSATGRGAQSSLDRAASNQ